jgi:hypothetical protein
LDSIKENVRQVSASPTLIHESPVPHGIYRVTSGSSRNPSRTPLQASGISTDE